MFMSPHDILSEQQIAVLQRSNPGDATQSRIYSAIRAEKNQGRSLEQSWQEAQKLLVGKKMAYYGDPDMDDTAECPYSMLFPKNDSALDTIIAGIAYQQLVHEAQPQTVKLKMRDNAYYGMTIKSIGPFWEDGTYNREELQMSPSSARFLQHLLPENGKMQMDAHERSAGHVEHFLFNR